MSAVFGELGIEQMTLADGALRLGVLYDLLGRFHHDDKRDATVRQFARRYHVDGRQARRVERLAVALFEQVAESVAEDPETETRLLRWAARLHEVGISVAYSGYHKHSAYIIRNADMPGFSRMEQAQMSNILLAHRGNLKKLRGLMGGEPEIAQALCLRLAVLFHRARTDLALPALALSQDARGYRLSADAPWLEANPLTDAALNDECREWKNLGVSLRLSAAQEKRRAMA
jgi:exopolyphosphatase/guanosine-5'-triphosphate,3'-diphosphate pyrophosphatase